MSDRSKVTLVLSEADARALVEETLTDPNCDCHLCTRRNRLVHEIKHALAECDCSGEVGR